MENDHVKDGILAAIKTQEKKVSEAQAEVEEQSNRLKTLHKALAVFGEGRVVDRVVEALLDGGGRLTSAELCKVVYGSSGTHFCARLCGVVKRHPDLVRRVSCGLYELVENGVSQ